MTKPAARLGDTTAHGGSVVVGFPTVLIGGTPAARLTDMHACPMVTAVVPHATGPIALGSMGVLIGNMPAARMGDMVTCVGPPDTIVMGCVTVLIGELSPGGGGGGGAGGGGGSPGSGGAGKISNVGVAIATYSSEPPEKPTTETHWIEFQFVDKAGNPVQGIGFEFTGTDGAKDKGALPGDGRIRREGISAGSCSVRIFSVSNARWSVAEARTDETVTMTADVEGYASGEPARISICKRDIKGADEVVESIETKVQGSKVEADWEYKIPETDEGSSPESTQGYSYPEYCFRVVVGGSTAVSGLLFFKDWIEIELKDGEGKPVGGEAYRVYLPNGEVREGKLDGGGRKKIEKVPPGAWDVAFPGSGTFHESRD